MGLFCEEYLAKPLAEVSTSSPFALPFQTLRSHRESQLYTDHEGMQVGSR